MEIRDLIYDMLLEEVQNKKLLENLFKKWQEENDKITLEDVEFIVTKFKGGRDVEGNNIPALQNKLDVKRPEIVAFLERYDGQYGTEKFEAKNLKNIASYSYAQIKSLFLDFDINLEEEVDEDDPFFEKAGVSKDDKVKASRDLWFGNKYLVYDSGDGFRIYRPKNQKESIRFGYWQDYLRYKHQANSSNQWCITWDRPGNMWATYRSEGRTYYMVIDESKDENDKYFISVLQPKQDKSQTYPFKLTNMYNTGGDRDVRMQDDDYNTCITCIYPKLNEREVQELIQPVEYDEQKELNVTRDEASRVNEREGHEYEFRRVRRPLKLRFIQNGGVLKSIRSFEAMDENLIRSYFEMITPGNVDDMFQSYETFKYAIRKSGIRRALQDKMFRVASENSLNPKEFGITSIFMKLIESAFKPIFISKQDSNIRIMENKENELVGIYNGLKGEWLEHGGIKYTPDFKEMLDPVYGVFDVEGKLNIKKNDDVEPDVKPNDQDNDQDNDQENPDQLQEQTEEQITYLVTTYSKSMSKDDNSNFYVISNVLDNDATVSIMSHRTWKDLGEPSFIEITDPNYDFDNPYSNIDDYTQKSVNERS
jgi:hypothetical protein